MRRRLSLRTQSINLDYLRSLATADGGSVNASLGRILTLLRAHGVASTAELARLLPAKKDGAKVASLH